LPACLRVGSASILETRHAPRPNQSRDGFLNKNNKAGK
jgi:hypothetical protein